MVYRLAYLIFTFWLWFISSSNLTVSAQSEELNNTQSHNYHDWQVLLVPMIDDVQNQLNNQSSRQLKSLVASNLLNAIDSGLTQKLTENKLDVVSKSRFFSDCTLSLCGHDNIQETLESIKRQTTKIGLVAFYTISPKTSFYDLASRYEETPSTEKHEPLNLEIKLIDPITFKILLSERLRLLEKLSYQSLFTLAQDMGTIILHSMSELKPKHQFVINLDNFVFEELNGLSTYIIANSNNQFLKLVTSSQQNTLFGQFFPVQHTQYELLSTMTAESLREFIKAFFQLENTSVKVEINLKSNGDSVINVTRSGNPYTPSFLTSLALIFATIIIVFWFGRRNVLNAKLELYSDERNATKWLKTHDNAKFAPYFLVKKWASPAIYWAKMQEESKELCQQATLYFDAGDITTSKLFLSKSLHMDTGNILAAALTSKIRELESREDKLSKDEQFIRNKLAKSVSNHKNRKPLKALKQLYQAREIALQNNKLKKQSKAINKLIKRIMKSESKPIESFSICSVGDNINNVIFNTKTIHIGRLPETSDLNWMGGNDGVFPINHTLVSRVGKHGQIFTDEGNFYYQDLNSKNGSFINRQRCKSNEKIRLSNHDLLQLGNKHPAKSVGLDVFIPKDKSFLQMSFNEIANNLLEKDDLSKLWPDNLLAQCNNLVYLNKTFSVLIHQQSGAINIVSSSEISDLTLEEDLIPLVEISLEPQPWLNPINNGFDILLDDTLVLGEMPLLIPCELKVKDFIVKFNHYEISANPLNQHELLE